MLKELFVRWWLLTPPPSQPLRHHSEGPSIPRPLTCELRQPTADPPVLVGSLIERGPGKTPRGHLLTTSPPTASTTTPSPTARRRRTSPRWHKLHHLGGGHLPLDSLLERLSRSSRTATSSSAPSTAYRGRRSLRTLNTSTSLASPPLTRRSGRTLRSGGKGKQLRNRLCLMQRRPLQPFHHVLAEEIRRQNRGRQQAASLLAVEIAPPQRSLPKLQPFRSKARKGGPESWKREFQDS